jgi:hypothetical protein
LGLLVVLGAASDSGWKIHGSATQRAGEPDLTITFHGRSIKAELKVGRNQPTKLQQYRIERWSKARLWAWSAAT